MKNQVFSLNHLRKLRYLATAGAGSDNISSVFSLGLLESIIVNEMFGIDKQRRFLEKNLSARIKFMLDSVKQSLYKSSANGSYSGLASWGGGKNVFHSLLFQGCCSIVHVSRVKQSFYVLLFQGGE